MDDQGDKFNDVYWIKFKDIAAARLAKAKLNKSSFFSNELKVKYAPEFETIEDTREKIEERRATILFKLKSKFNTTEVEKELTNLIRCGQILFDNTQEEGTV